MGSYDNLLYAPPSFLTGFASVIDIGGTLQRYNESNHGDQADVLSLLSDIRAVKEDLAKVRKKIQEENEP